MNKDQVEGKVKLIKGQVKEAVGKLIGDKSMEARGKIENAAGKVQEKLGDAKAVLKR